MSPFLCLGTSGPNGADVAPRGDQPGFVHVLDDSTIAIPDWPGNNRLDSMTNILVNPQVAILFMIPGLAETLRVNGEAMISVDPELLARWETGNGKRPKAVIVVHMREAFLHCGKAMIRSKLWSDNYRIEPGKMPTFGQMLKDQTRVAKSVEEIDAALAKAYKETLY